MMMDTTKNKVNLEKVKEWAETNIICVLNALSIEYVDRGKSLTGCCPVPYHKGDATNKTAFNWSIEKNMWACWTHRCHEDTYPNIFGLVMSMKELSFPAALHYLNDLMLNPNTISIPRAISSNKKQYNISQENTPINKSKLDLLYPDTYFTLDRGISEDIIKKHRVGYWQKSGSIMHKRAIVPVFDEQNELVGFSGRDITGLSHQKWIHAKDFVHYSNEVFTKSSILYNLNNIKKLCPRPTSLIIVEGPIDLWKLEMAGIQNVVATLGLGLSFVQVSKLVELGINKLTICYDNDKKTKAGEKAAISIQNNLADIFTIEIKIPELNKDFGEMDVDEICRIFLLK